MVEKTARPVRASVRERSYSEEVITVDKAITVSGVISIIILIAQDTASLPLILYGKKGRNKFRAVENPYYALMHDQPNPEHSAMTFRESIVSHLIAWGNFYAQIIIDEAGLATSLWPLRPDKMSVERVDGEKVYKYQTRDGKPRVFLRDEILHIPAFGFDGLTGLSRIALARHSIGESISTQKFGSKFFANGANFDMVLRHPGELSDVARKNLDTSIKEHYTGVDNSHKFIILEENMSVEKIGIPPDDAQFLESRKFQLSDINRMIGPVPPHMIGDVTSSTSWGTGIDSQEQGYVNHTLHPYAVRIEQGLGGQLLLPSDRQAGYFYEHLFDGILRGDIATRYAAYQTGINNGFMTRNEARARENLNPRKGLDELLMPLNMTTIGGSNSSDSGNPDGTDAAANANALAPLWQDAIARVLKRESNDVLGASKRLQVKGQQADWENWIDHFYSFEQPAFLRKQFKPLIEAMYRLYGVEDLAADEFFHEYLFQRGEQVKALSARQLAEGMAVYIAGASQKLFAFVNTPITFGALEEADYE